MMHCSLTVLRIIKYNKTLGLKKTLNGDETTEKVGVYQRILVIILAVLVAVYVIGASDGNLVINWPILVKKQRRRSVSINRFQ